MDCPTCHHPNVEGARFCAKCGALQPTQQSGDDPYVGQIIGGRYRIIKLLGEGGMGRVYEAEQQMGTNTRKVAVKTLQSQYAREPDILARFQRECGTVSQLEHPNTIQFFDFGQTPSEDLYIAMEFVQGDSLASELEKHGAMAPDRVAHILQQVCGSLQEAHEQGIVHRDLKPDNVMLTTRAGQADFVKVLDFGIAKRREARDAAQEKKLTQQGMVLGTPPYMSPEQFTGKELDARSDIYSLGVMAYEMLTGRLPFDAETPWEWATKHMTVQPYPFDAVPMGANVPASMKAAVMRALSKNRDERQPSVKAFFDEFAGDARAPLASNPLGASKGSTQAMEAPDAGEAKGRTQVGAPMFAADASTPMGLSAGGGPVMGLSAGGGPVMGLPAGGAHPTPAGGQSFPTAPQPATPTGGKSGGGKGLVFGLAGAAGVLAIIGIIVVARGMKPKEDVTITNPFGAASSGDTTVAPVPASAMPTASAPTTPTAGTVAAATTHVPTTATAAPKPTATTPPPPALKGDAACTEAKRLADNGDIVGASRAYSGCAGPMAGAARASIQSHSAAAAQRKVFNGDCNGAKAIAAAANAAGVGSQAAAVVSKSCK